MSLHFIPNPDNPNINYINFTTFTVNSANLSKKIESFYKSPEVSFPLPVEHTWATQANFASNIESIGTLLGIGPKEGSKPPIASRYDIDDPTNPYPSVETSGKIEVTDVEKPNVVYKRLDVTDALFDVMEKKIFQITANLVCTSNEQSAIASDILRFIAQKHHPGKEVVLRGESRSFRSLSPKGFAIWVSTGAPSAMANYNFFPLVNHCFLTKMVVNSNREKLNLSPESFITYVNSRPLQLKFTLTFQEIQAAYRSINPMRLGPRNRSVADSKPRVE